MLGKNSRTELLASSTRPSGPGRGELVDLRVDGAAILRRAQLALEHVLLHLHEIDAGGAGVVDRHQRAVIGPRHHVPGGAEHAVAIAAERADQHTHREEAREYLGADRMAQRARTHGKAFVLRCRFSAMAG
jgi:hypothetical protein